MRQTIAFFKYYFGLMIKDKVTLIWSVFFPLIIALMGYFPQQGHFDTTLEKQTYIYVFWSFALTMIFINGIGTQFATIRQYGLLKSFYSLSGKKYPFIVATILAQLILGIATISIITIVLGTLMKVLTLNLLANLIIYSLLIIPLAPAFLIISFLPIKAESLVTISSILAIIMFFIAGNTNNNFGGLEWINPVYFFREISLMFSNNISNISLLVIVYLIYVALGLFSVLKVNINSKTNRT
ncbi:hypothetical protein [Staphylococcus chromogenes]|uniref:hypothetical protein n=1 Tax=Staphylococcus chromogenes TaxID=46126 RepID=UPI002883A9A0|nr:hypothetical protein [Staphylococcus chromogenes]MDT0700354.1 hypothetical protein [Staphylococcus chromogenes]